MTVEELIATYIRSLQGERNLSRYTLRNYRSDLRAFFGYLEEGGGREKENSSLVSTVDRQRLRGYLAHLRQEGVASGSIARKVSTIRSFYRFLAREGHILSNPLAAVRGPKRERRLPYALTVQQTVELITAPEADTLIGLRDRALLELLYAAGLRISELIGLDLSDIDLREGTVRVTGKGNKERIALMGRPAQDALRYYLLEARPHLARLPEERALFLNRDGGRLSARAVQIMIQRYAVQVGLDQKVHPHLLRHTFATHLLDGGADLRVVQELLGHSSPSTTQIYTHVTEAQQRSRYNLAFFNQYRDILKRGVNEDEDTADQRA